MKNIEKYGVQEMGFKEIEKTDGGLIPKSWRGENYNVLLGCVFGWYYDAGYLAGKHF